MPYADWITRISPPWLQRDWAGGFMRAAGAELDEMVAEMIQARRAMMPGIAAASSFDDALAFIGSERQLERGPSETSASYGERLRLAWDTWQRAGSHKALLEQLRIAGFPAVSTNLFSIQRSGRRCRLDGAGTLVITDGAIWTFDGKPPEAYAQMGLLFLADQPDLTWTEGDGFSAEAARFNRIVHRWRGPAKAEFMGTHIVVSGSYWGDMTWGSFTWGGVGRFIPPR